MIEVALHPVSVQLRQTLSTARGPVTELDGVVVSFDDGRHRGWGEATPVPGFGIHRAATVAEHLETLSVDVARHGEDLEALLGALERRDATVPAARFAAQGALLDLLARRARRSLAAEVSSRVGCTHGDVVHCAALVSGSSVDEVTSDALDAVGEGFDTVKLKVGTAALSDDIAVVAAVRAAVGPDVRLRLDANGAWDIPGARTAVEALGPYGIDLIEEPTSGLRDLGELASLVEVPVAVDESVTTLEDLARASDAAPVVIVKPARLGGVIEVAVATLAIGRCGARIVVTSLLDGAVARATAAAVAATVDDEERHGLATGRLLDRDVVTPPWGTSPTIALVDDGIGIDPDL